MELKKQTDAAKLIKELNKNAKKLREDTTLHYVASLMDDAAEMLRGYVRKDVERG